MNRRFLYIVNEKAGTRTKKDLVAFIERQTTEMQIPFERVASVAGGDYSFLKPLIREKAVTDVIIAGGDGTVNQAIQSLRGEDVNFGIIPCGSGNGLALAAGISRSPETALQIAFAGKARAIDAFQINEHFSCMLSGLGFDAKVAHDFAAQPTRGLATYIRQVMRNFFSAPVYSFTLGTDEHSLSFDAYFVCIANGNQFGNNFTIAPKASMEDGLLDIVIATKQTKLALLVNTLSQVTGRNLVQEGSINLKKGIVYFRTGRLTLVNHSAAPLHVDGEPVTTADQFSIELLPRCYRLLQP